MTFVYNYTRSHFGSSLGEVRCLHRVAQDRAEGLAQAGLGTACPEDRIWEVHVMSRLVSIAYVERSKT